MSSASASASCGTSGKPHPTKRLQGSGLLAKVGRRMVFGHVCSVSRGGAGVARVIAHLCARVTSLEHRSR